MAFGVKIKLGVDTSGSSISELRREIQEAVESAMSSRAVEIGNLRVTLDADARHNLVGEIRNAIDEGVYSLHIDKVYLDDLQNAIHTALRQAGFDGDTMTLKMNPIIDTAGVDRLIGKLDELKGVVEQINAKNFTISNIFQYDAGKAEGGIRALDLYKQEALGLLEAVDSAAGALDRMTKSGAASLGRLLTSSGEFNKFWEMSRNYDATKIGADINGATTVNQINKQIYVLQEYKRILDSILDTARTQGVAFEPPDYTRYETATRVLEEYNEAQRHLKQTFEDAARSAASQRLNEPAVGFSALVPQLDELRAKMEQVFDFSTLDTHSDTLKASLQELIDLMNQTKATAGAKETAGLADVAAAALIAADSVREVAEAQQEAAQAAEKQEQAQEDAAEKATVSNATLVRAYEQVMQLAQDPAIYQRFAGQIDAVGEAWGEAQEAAKAAIQESAEGIEQTLEVTEEEYRKIQDLITMMSSEAATDRAQQRQEAQIQKQTDATYKQIEAEEKLAAKREADYAKMEALAKKEEADQAASAQRQIDSWKSVSDARDKEIQRMKDAESKMLADDEAALAKQNEAEEKMAARREADYAKMEALAKKEAEDQEKRAQKQIDSWKAAENARDQELDRMKDAETKRIAEEEAATKRQYDEQQKRIEQAIRLRTQLAELQMQHPDTYDAHAEEIQSAMEILSNAESVSAEKLQELRNNYALYVEEIKTGTEAQKRNADAARDAEARQVDAATQAVNLQRQIRTWCENNTVAYGEQRAELDKMLEELDTPFLISPERVAEIRNMFATIRNDAEETGRTGKTAFEKIQAGLSKFGEWYSVSRIFMSIINSLRTMYRNVVELDKAMTELKKVTDLTSAGYQKFGQQAVQISRDVGATLSDTINATADFARLGYSVSDAADLAQAALVYKNVGD